MVEGNSVYKICATEKRYSQIFIVAGWAEFFAEVYYFVIIISIPET